MRIDFQSPVTGARNVVAGNTDLTLSRLTGRGLCGQPGPAQPDWPDGGRIANAVANVCRTLRAATRMVQRWKPKECSMPRPTSWPSIWGCARLTISLRRDDALT
jgi:hypothetical protein